MRIKTVTGPRFFAVCLGCGQHVLAGDGCPTVADLDGEAYKAYYCVACAVKLPQSGVDASLAANQLNARGIP